VPEPELVMVHGSPDSAELADTLNLVLRLADVLPGECQPVPARRGGPWLLPGGHRYVGHLSVRGAHFGRRAVPAPESRKAGAQKQELGRG
jgi:hypothetical protein